eukprot:gene25944-11623_t
MQRKDDLCDILSSDAGESGSNASTSENLIKSEKVDLDAAAFEEFSLEASDFSGMGLSAEDMSLLNADDLRALFEDSSDNGLDSIPLEEEPRKKRKILTQPSLLAPPAPGQARQAEAAPSGAAVRREDGRSSAANSGNGLCNQASSKPAMGFPAGQLPPLPAGAVGMVWGLPTTPLQIMPKTSTASHGALGPSTSSAAPVSSVQPFSGMMPFPMPPMPHQASQAGASRMPPAMSISLDGRAPLGLMMMPSMFPGAPMMSGARNVSKPGSTAGPQASAPQPTIAKAGLKRSPSDSARLPFPAMMPFPMSQSTPGLSSMFPCNMDVGPTCAGGVMLSPIAPSLKTDTLADIMAVTCGKPKGSQKPPLGLQLKKSDSFADLISNCLRESV